MRNLLLLFLLFPVFLPAQYAQTRVLRNIADGKVTQWETVEIGLKIPEQENIYRTYLNDHARGSNPYSQHHLRMQFTCNGKNYVACAYYVQDAQPDEDSNAYVSSNSEWPWRIRFCVPDTGTWTTMVMVGEDLLTAVPESCTISFRCFSGTHHGFLHIGDDHRHLQYTDGTPFFIIGQNIPWTYGKMLHGRAGKFPQYLCGYYDVYHYINDLADNGGNFFRIIMSPWSTAIEWDQTGVYDQSNACALDSMIHLAEQRGLHVQLSLDISFGFDGIASSDGDHPYIKSFMKPGMQACDLLDDSAALVAFDNYFRYCYSRWLFSPTVTNIEMCCEEWNWQGFKGNEKKFDAFFVHIHELMKNEFGDSTHLISMSEKEGNADYRFKSDALDYIDIHNYTNDYKTNIRRFKLVNRKSLLALDKPFLFGEMGMCNGPVNACDANDFEYCSDISFHNALWSTAFSGSMGTGLEWWQWENDAMRKNNFPALEYFIDTVVGKITDYSEHEMWTGNGLETFYASSEWSAAGWVHNKSYWWANVSDTCKDRDGKMMLHPNDDDNAPVPEKTAGNKFVVGGFHSRARYSVVFYDTRVRGKELSHIELKSNMFGKLSIPMPNDTDCAFRIVRVKSVDF
ncbi:MAG TPA: DUF5060 domain-containing protein [Bacteroidia bacterium]|nr:DUF5060 domain-containing protein [Bacteroidia bacterium]